MTLPSKNRGGPTYEQLAAKMREAPSFASAEEVIKMDYPLKLPSRRSVQLWNTPEISQFRGYQEELDANEEHRTQHSRELLEIREATREAGTHLTDVGIVHQMMAHQRQQQTALQQHLSGLNGLNRLQMEGMAAEQRAELIRLGTAQQEAANRAAMAEQALVGLRDVSLEHRNMLGQLAERQGVTQHNIDNRHTSTTIVHQNVDQEAHNRAMDMLRTHADMFGQYMRQQNLNAEQMQRLLYMHLMRNQTPAPVIHILLRQPMDVNRPEPMETTQYGGGGPPPPPPGAGAAMKVRKQGKKKGPRPINITYGTRPPLPPAPAPPPAPVPEPIPTIPAGVPHFHIGSPPPPPASRRARTPRPSRAKPSPPLVPWQSGTENPPSLPAVVPAAPAKRASEQESQEAPVALRARAKSRSRGASVRAASAQTVLYEGDQPVLRPAPKRRGRPHTPSTPAVVLPTQEAANQHAQEQMAEASRRGKEKAVKARLLANAAKYQRPSAKARAASAPATRDLGPEAIPEAPPPVKKPRVRRAAITAESSLEKKPRGRPPRKPAAMPEAPPAPEMSARKVRIRKVAIQSSDLKDTVAKRGRGRPRGSLGLKKRNALLEEELRRMSTVVA